MKCFTCLLSIILRCFLIKNSIYVKKKKSDTAKNYSVNFYMYIRSHYYGKKKHSSKYTLNYDDCRQEPLNLTLYLGHAGKQTVRLYMWEHLCVPKYISMSLGQCWQLLAFLTERYLQPYWFPWELRYENQCSLFIHATPELVLDSHKTASFFCCTEKFLNCKDKKYLTPSNVGYILQFWHYSLSPGNLKTCE